MPFSKIWVRDRDQHSANRSPDRAAPASVPHPLLHDHCVAIVTSIRGACGWPRRSRWMRSSCDKVRSNARSRAAAYFSSSSARSGCGMARTVTASFTGLSDSQVGSIISLALPCAAALRRRSSAGRSLGSAPFGLPPSRLALTRRRAYRPARDHSWQLCSRFSFRTIHAAYPK
jgi:hypothetical protein